MTNMSKKQDLNQFLIAHLNTIYDTLQLFDRTASPTEEKINWNVVLQMSEHLSKQATIVGMLWTGESPKSEALKETMESYFNALQGFLLCCHGSSVGAGPTLSSIIHVFVKKIVDSSFRLLQGSVSLYGNNGMIYVATQHTFRECLTVDDFAGVFCSGICNLEGSYEKDKKPSIPQLSGVVWEACSSFKKVPATNVTAIGRAITQVALSMKDVLREMKEVKPACASSECKASGDNNSDDDIGDDLSPEEMEVAQMVAEIVSETIMVIKELIRVITGMIKLENPKDNSGFVDLLEKLLKLCQGTGVQIDELGACVYPPQEINKMRQTVKIIQGNVNEVEAEVEHLKNTSDSFSGACRKLRNSLKHIETELNKRCEAEVIVEMQNVTLSS